MVLHDWNVCKATNVPVWGEKKYIKKIVETLVRLRRALLDVVLLWR